MTLLDLRRYAIRNQIRIQFTAPAAGDCIVNEHGVLRMPSLAAASDFHFDNSLTGVEKFVLTPVREPARPQKVSRDDLEALLGDTPKASEPAHDE